MKVRFLSRAHRKRRLTSSSTKQSDASKTHSDKEESTTVPAAYIPRPFITRANCTHMVMDRVYGHDVCQICYRFPSLGWLYVCAQDNQTQPPHAELTQASLNGNGKDEVKSSLRKELEEVGLSESVIRAAEAGHYTDEQLGKLTAQKLHMKMMISIHMRSLGLPAAKPEHPVLPNTDGTLLSALPKRELDEQVALDHPQEPEQKCCFRACHTCRPYFKDRIFTSLETIFSVDGQSLTYEDSAVLPFSNAAILRNILLRPPPVPTPLYVNTTRPPSTTHDETETTLSTQSSTDTQTRQRIGRRRFYKLGSRSSSEILRDLAGSGWRRSLKNAFKGVFKANTKAKKRRIEPEHELEDTESQRESQSSNITLPLPRTGTHRDLQQQVNDFDLGLLKRVSSARRRTIAAEEQIREHTAGLRGDVLNSNSVVMGTATGTASPHGESGRSTDFEDTTATSSSSVYSFYTGAVGAANCEVGAAMSHAPSEAGSEVEVEGGVALTEEAVETGTPDIITQVPAQKALC